ncbi:hypothetical protein AAG570_008084 [Ranatra chinensis]|uniref:Uncharacterized protein n=1 Tax=Ranatra chinensis TaxID=642074 RepID=A0ABD0XTR1_9HEMI
MFGRHLQSERLWLITVQSYREEDEIGDGLFRYWIEWACYCANEAEDHLGHPHLAERQIGGISSGALFWRNFFSGAGNKKEEVAGDAAEIKAEVLKGYPPESWKRIACHQNKDIMTAAQSSLNTVKSGMNYRLPMVMKQEERFSTVKLALNEDLRYSSYKVSWLQKRNAKKLLRESQTIWSFSDEKNFCQDQKHNTRDNRWLLYSAKDIPRVTLNKFPQTVMVFGRVSSEGDVMPPHFFQEDFRRLRGVAEHCSQALDKKGRPYVWQQDSALATPLGKVKNGCPKMSTTSPNELINKKKKENEVMEEATHWRRGVNVSLIRVQGSRDARAINELINKKKKENEVMEEATHWRRGVNVSLIRVQGSRDARAIENEAMEEATHWRHGVNVSLIRVQGSRDAGAIASGME